ncbi:hypothetical protein [Amycolatopsis sp. cg9]|uniref:hypothetical protein n=1 Tax=Amycolatopsis sp. cg9 TaxID=3238801 RepID=UPI0035249EA0
MIIESGLVPRSAAEPCADRLIEGRYLVGVADGATRKSWDTGPDGAALAEAIAGHLAGIARTCPAREVVDSATEVVEKLLAADGVAAGSGSAVSFCVLHTGRQEVWRVGEARLMLDGEPVRPRRSGERIVAEARALVLRHRLAAGAAVADLCAEDPGRAAVQQLLKALTGLRNHQDDPAGFGALDGRPVPDRFVEVIPLPRGTREVVITTDGYPEPAPTLAEAERLLAERLARDPLMIDPPETKGLRPAANSFDDRAYVRLGRVTPA